MSRLNNIQKGPSNLAPRIVIYGTEGIGKSTFGSQAPSPIFIQTEDGLGQISVDKFPVAIKLSSVLSDLQALEDNNHQYGTVVIDSLDWLERLIWDHICAECSVASIELAAGGYGKGYVQAVRIWRDILTQLDRLRDRRGMCVVCVAHAKIERFEDPESASYDRYAPRLHKLASGLICEWADAVLFATRKIRTLEEKTKAGTRVIASTVKGAEDRVLRTVGGPACVAKNRFGIQQDIPLSWDAFMTSMGA